VDDVDARVFVGEDVDAQHVSGWIIVLHRTRHESSLQGAVEGSALRSREARACGYNKVRRNSVSPAGDNITTSRGGAVGSRPTRCCWRTGGGWRRQQRDVEGSCRRRCCQRRDAARG
jgi:hypothetical protein